MGDFASFELCRPKPQNVLFERDAYAQRGSYLKHVCHIDKARDIPQNNFLICQERSSNHWQHGILVAAHANLTTERLFPFNDESIHGNSFPLYPHNKRQERQVKAASLVFLGKIPIHKD